MHSFFVLLYKDFLLRKRQPLLTSCELILPFIFAFIPLVVFLAGDEKLNRISIDYSFDDYYLSRTNTSWPFLSKTYKKLEDPYRIFNESLRNSTVYIFYTPKNFITKRLVIEAANTWKIKSGFTGALFTSAFETKSHLDAKALISTSSAKIISTIFHNMEGKLPSNLSYTIRINGLVDEFNQVYKFIQNDPDAYQKTFFLGWQAAVEQTFIKHSLAIPNNMTKTERDHILHFNVSLQSFPALGQRYTLTSQFILDFWPLVFSVGFLMFSSVLIYRITLEKANGMQVLMSATGLPRFTYWISSFASYVIPGIFISFIISFIYLYFSMETLFLFRRTNFVVLWFCFSCFIINTILFCFIFTIFFNNTRYAVIGHISLHFAIFIALYINYNGTTLTKLDILTPISKLFWCTVPMLSIFYVFEAIFCMETRGEPIYFGDLFKCDTASYCYFPFITIGNFIALIVLTITLWYCDSVWPLHEGMKQPFYFPFMINYWFGSCFKKTETDVNVNSKKDSDFFETEIDDNSGIIIQNVTKRMDTLWFSKTVIDNLTFKIHPRQITVVTGHKRSGKTALFRMICGFSKPTSGKIFINGLDISRDHSKIKKIVGVCPQECALHEALTVHEHLQIFAGLKGVNFSEINKQASAMENILSFVSDRDTLIQTLSMKLKMKLNLGLAFIGNSQIVLLDDPFQFMSLNESLNLWKVLLSMQEDYTILLLSSTQKIAYLGDRIAHMSHGRLIYSGTLKFLKKKLDVGFRIKLFKDSSFHEDEIIELIRRHYKRASYEKITENFAVINLHSMSNIRAGRMFEELEFVKDDMGVKSFEIEEVTKAEVFMNEPYIEFLKNKNSKFVRTEGIYNEGSFQIERYINKSWSVHYSRIYGTFYKNAHYIFRLSTLPNLQILMPIICMWLGYLFLQENSVTKYLPFYLNPNRVYGHSIMAFVEDYEDNSSIATSVIQNELIAVMEENDVSVYYHKDIRTLSELYSFAFYPVYANRFVVGFSVSSAEDVHFIAWYNSMHHHSIPLALNMMHTAILKHVTGNGSIGLINDPLPFDYVEAGIYNIKTKTSTLFLFVPFVAASIGSSFILIPLYEKISKVKLFQLMSSMSTEFYWFSMFLWDLFVYLLLSLILIFPKTFFNLHGFQNYESIGPLFAVFFFYGWSIIPLSYLITLVIPMPTSAFVCLVVFYTVIGLIFLLLNASESYWAYIFMCISQILPMNNLIEGFLKVFDTSLQNAFCSLFSQNILNITCAINVTDATAPIFKCCPNLCGDECDIYHSYIALDFQNGILREIVIMFILGLIFFIFLALIEEACYQKYKGASPVKPISVERHVKLKDPLFFGVAAERERIQNLIASGKNEDTLMTLDLTKFYDGIPVLNNLTFGVSTSRSLGIMGGFESGKSTLMKILSGEVIPTHGYAFVEGVDLVKDLKKFQSRVGYCSQYDTLINHLTGREMLRFFSRLRGVIGTNPERELIKMIELEEVSDKLIKFYSYADKRKLGVALAILGSPVLLLLDEPTTGLDFEIQELLWNFLNKIKRYSKIAILISTTSILECQVLSRIGICNRLAIVNQGKFTCIGSLSELEEKYGSGKIVKIILKLEMSDMTSRILEVKAFFEENVPKATLLNYHEGIFAFHVGESYMSLSSLFHLLDYMLIKFNFHKYLVNNSSFNKLCFAYTDGTRIS